MAFANKTLICSLTQDIKSVKNVCNDINTHLDEVECKSWICPMKSGADISKIKDSEKAYVLCLELLMDRIYLFLNTMLAYTKRYSDNEGTSKFVTEPNTFSLGITANVLWKRILQMDKAIEEKQRSQYNLQPQTHSNVGTQTEGSTLHSCDSCTTFNLCMKTLSSKVSTTIKYSNMEKSRKLLQRKLYDITQFGFMNELTIALINDVEKLITDNKYLENVNERLTNENVDLSKQFEAQKTTISELESTIKEQEMSLDTEKNKYSELQNKLLEQTILNTKIVDKLKNVEESNVELTATLNILEEHNNSSKDRINQLNIHVLELQNTNKTHQQTTSEFKRNFEELQSQNQTYKDQVNAMKKELLLHKEIILKGENDFIKFNECKEDNITLSKTLSNMAVELDITKDKCTHLEILTKKYTSYIKEYSTNFNSIQNCVQKTIEFLKKMDNVIDIARVNLEENINIFEDSIGAFQAIIKRKNQVIRIKDDFQKISKLAQNCFLANNNCKIKGDPLVDMKLQIESNNTIIKQLYDQNELLSKTISRLQKIQNGVLGN